MADSCLTAGVVGVGHLGRIHARIYSELDDCRLVGVVDSDEGRAAEVARMYQTEACGSLEQLLKLKPTVISLAVPTVLHAQLGINILESGCHLLVEKPIAASVDEARQLITSAEKARMVLQVGHLERFNPAYRSAQSLIDAPRFIETHRLGVFTARSIDVDVILDLMIHDLDLILSMDRSELKKIDGAGVAILTDKVDIANARLTFTSGCVANVTASRVSAEKVRKFRIFQQDTYFSIDLQQQEARHVFLDFAGGMPQIKHNKLEVPDDEPLKEEIKAFLQAVRFGKPPEVTGPDGLRALEVAIKIQEKIFSQ